jgi:catechol 2,3-dioxygenase-like lactoylglutathione lyase family enzyme
MQPQPLIAVADVEKSSWWYQRLLGCVGAHGGPKYERLNDREGHLIMQLHAWDAVEHPHLGNADSEPYGNGVLLWFQVDDFDAAVSRARKMSAEVIEDPHLNVNANHREIWLRDRDGYVVVLASGPGDIVAAPRSK